MVNTSIQRCLVKAIALHGLGLYVYAGEDLPSGEERPTAPAATPTNPTVTPIRGPLIDVCRTPGWSPKRRSLPGA